MAIPSEQQIRQRAIDQYNDEGTIEIDPDAEVSMSDDPGESGGAYVKAWVWVNFDDVKKEG